MVVPRGIVYLKYALLWGAESVFAWYTVMNYCTRAIYRGPFFVFRVSYALR